MLANKSKKAVFPTPVSPMSKMVTEGLDHGFRVIVVSSGWGMETAGGELRGDISNSSLANIGHRSVSHREVEPKRLPGGVRNPIQSLPLYSCRS